VERRQSPRLVIDHPLKARAIGVDAELTIVDVSYGGFRVESPVAFAPNSVHVFDVETNHGSRVAALHAKLIYCRPKPSGPDASWECGFAFNHSDRATDAGVHIIMEDVTTVLEFD
jgi:hypothetical protein